MRVRGILLAAGTASFVLVLGAFRPPNGAPQEILNEEGYAAVMKEIDLTIGDTTMNIDATYWDDLGVVTDRLTMLFERVQAFWTARQVQPAVRLPVLPYRVPRTHRRWIPDQAGYMSRIPS